jgi:hypothetical protein
MLGLGGLLGLTAAWIRIVVRPQRLRSSPRLRRSIVAGLLCGIAAALYVFVDMVVGNYGDEALMPGGAVLLGLLLTAATMRSGRAGAVAMSPSLRGE